MEEFHQKIGDSRLVEEENLAIHHILRDSHECRNDPHQNSEDSLLNHGEYLNRSKDGNNVCNVSTIVGNLVQKASTREHTSHPRAEQIQFKACSSAHPRVHISLREKLMESRAVLHSKLDYPILLPQGEMHSCEETNNSSVPFAYSFRGKQKARKLSPLGPELIENGLNCINSRGWIENPMNTVNVIGRKTIKTRMSHGLVEAGISSEGLSEMHMIDGLTRDGTNHEFTKSCTSAKNSFSCELLDCDSSRESVENNIKLAENDIRHGSVENAISGGLMKIDIKLTENGVCYGSAENDIRLIDMSTGHELFDNGISYEPVEHDIRSPKTDICEDASNNGISCGSDENDIRLMKNRISSGSVESSISYRSSEHGIKLSENSINYRALKHRYLHDLSNDLSYKALRHKHLHDLRNDSLKVENEKDMKTTPFMKGTHVLHGVSQVKDVGDLLKCDENLPLEADVLESLPVESFKSEENIHLDGDSEINLDDYMENELNPIGNRVATAGWYVCDQGTVLLAHEDGSCSFYDAVNMEGKAEYRCPDGAAPIPCDDCWLIKAVGSDGYTNKYIVAATSGSALDAGFCSWDFDTRSVAAYYCDSENHINDVFQTTWYKPCGPLIASAGTVLKTLTLHDIRDGDILTTCTTIRHISSLDFSSPLQWIKKDKLVLAENQALSVWDVNAMDGKSLQYIMLQEDKQVCAFYIHDVEDDCSAGIRRRPNFSETERYDGIFCSKKDINVLDFRVPGGIGLCFTSLGEDLQSVYARGDTILTGGVHPTYNECGMQQWSIRNGKLVCRYAFQPSASHYAQLSLTQVWGSCNAVMAVNGNGLHIYKGFSEISQSQNCVIEEVEGILGTQDLFNPSFDYAHSRVLLVSRDRPASWCYWTL